VGYNALLFREVVMSDAKPAAGPSPVVADLGRRRRKEIKDLRKGKGALLDDARKLIEQLQADRAIAGGAQPVIVIVKERRRRFGFI
jgi:hypothetical protein